MVTAVKSIMFVLVTPTSATGLFHVHVYVPRVLYFSVLFILWSQCVHMHVDTASIR